MRVGDNVRVGDATGIVVELRPNSAIVEFDSGRHVTGKRLWCLDAQMQPVEVEPSHDLDGSYRMAMEL